MFFILLYFALKRYSLIHCIFLEKISIRKFEIENFQLGFRIKFQWFIQTFILMLRCTISCCTDLMFHCLKLHPAMLHYLMLHYLLLQYLMLRCVNVALYYVPLCCYCTTICCCTLFILHYLRLYYFNVALCDVVLF